MSTPATPARTPNQWWVGIVSGMASYIDACAIVSAGIALVIYQGALGLTNSQVGLASSGLTLAIAFGALFGGRLGDRFGRKHVFSVTMLVIVLGSALQTFSPNFIVLLAGTFLVGLGTGADLPVSLATIAETADEDSRGKIIGLSNVLWIVGILGAILTSSIVGNWGLLGGQILYGQVGVIALVTLLLRLPLPETQTWLEARAERERGVETVRAERASLSSLMRTPYLKPFVALIVFYSLVNVPANTGGQFTTWINVNIIGMDVAFSSQLSLLLMPLGFIWGVWFMRIVDTDRRMPYFYLGAACYVGAYFIYILAGFHVWSFVAVTVINAFGGAFAFEGIMKVWTQESFPTLLRTTAQGSIIFVARLVAALTAAVTPALLALNPRIAYLILAGIAIVGYAFAIWGFRGAQRNEFALEGHAEADVAAGEAEGLDFSVTAAPKS
ncbi:MAG: MFS transporter [Actinomyces sp.]|uniref:MFS transporter n=1 Tax=Actinomyces sp. TaxID=29317 RepID=UPI0026DC5203|nr:MFS transporter [Actinomyces sp.]MDO4243088.1 MFS transporter [Actinomyces sp.]